MLLHSKPVQTIKDIKCLVGQHEWIHIKSDYSPVLGFLCLTGFKADSIISVNVNVKENVNV